MSGLPSDEAGNEDQIDMSKDSRNYGKENQIWQEKTMKLPELLKGRLSCGILCKCFELVLFLTPFLIITFSVDVI